MIDKTQEAYLAQGTDIYARRLGHYLPFEMVAINVPKQVRQKPINEQKMEEGKLILKYLNHDDVLVTLDEKGREYSSEDFSKFIAQQQNVSVKRLVFLIGGPFGFNEAVYNRSRYRISLSKMTFSHQMIRLFFTEQLYRACTILKGEKYHHQ